ncbi:hypothetical protein SNE40_009187 [Patella caerulea]|uniref:Uncharacterized protein n=1 Tax=Patella caerulea TaxID=87958 RepID=A0AAN8Q2S8_PATCE
MNTTWYLALCIFLCECISGLSADTGELDPAEIAGVSIGAFVAVFCVIELILCNWERIKRLCSRCCATDTADCRETNVQLPIPTISIADPNNLEDRIRYGLEPDVSRPVTPIDILLNETREITPLDPPPSYDEVMANTHPVPSAPPEQTISYVPSKPSSPSAPTQYLIPSAPVEHTPLTNTVSRSINIGLPTDS